MALCLVLTTRFFSISGIFHRSILSHYFLLFWPFLLLHDFPSFLAAWWFDWLWPTDSVMRSQNSSSPAPLWWSNGRGGDLCLRQILPFHPPFSSSLFVADLPLKGYQCLHPLVWFNWLFERVDHIKCYRPVLTPAFVHYKVPLETHCSEYIQNRCTLCGDGRDEQVFKVEGEVLTF